MIVEKRKKGCGGVGDILVKKSSKSSFFVFIPQKLIIF